MKYFLLSAFLLISWNISEGQESASPSWFHQKPYNYVSLAAGINQVKEGNLVGLPGTGALVRFSYGRERTKRHLSNFNLSLDYCRMKTSLEDVSVSLNTKLHLGYDYNFVLVNHPHFTYFLGPDAELNYTLNFMPNWDESHYYWADYFGIGATNYFVNSFKNENLLWIKASFPVFALVSRPEISRPYKIDDLSLSGILQNLNSNLVAGSWNILFFLDLQIEYRFKITDRVSQSVGYRFEFDRVSTYNTNSYQQSSQLIGIKLFF